MSGEKKKQQKKQNKPIILKKVAYDSLQLSNLSIFLNMHSRKKEIIPRVLRSEYIFLEHIFCQSYVQKW